MPGEGRRVIFGFPVERGEVLHAVVDTGPAEKWIRFAAPLCTPTRGLWKYRVTPEHSFSPEGLSFLPGRVCDSCIHVWSARYAEPIPGLDRPCRGCGLTQPVTMFRADRRTSDGLSTRCEDCRNRSESTRQRSTD